MINGLGGVPVLDLKMTVVTSDSNAVLNRSGQTPALVLTFLQLH